MIVTIDKLVPEGKGLASLPDGKKVFVDKGYPGDVVEIELYKSKRRHAFARIIEVIKPSPRRTIAPCPYFDQCGGCPWQGMDYVEQCSWKQQLVQDALTSIGKLTPHIFPIIPARETFTYRNKTEFSFDLPPDTASIQLGFHIPGKRFDILPVDQCLVQSEVANQVLQFLQNFFASQPLTVFHPINGRGFLKHVTLRYSRASNALLCIVVTNKGDFPCWKELADGLKQQFGDRIQGIVWSSEKQQEGRQTKREIEAVSGQSFLIEELLGIRYKIRASSFFQVNTVQAEVLAGEVLKRAEGFFGKAFDVYCGNGFFGLMLAKQGISTTGIELDPQLVEDATANAQENGLSNFTILEGNARKVLKEMILAGEKADLVVVDPPRAGLHEKVVTRIAGLCPKKIIYVSCNPATFARDCAWFADVGYMVATVQPIDLFPHTHHCEMVGELLPV